jgi:RimJ/RimL family protein N-acetyltransferase
VTVQGALVTLRPMVADDAAAQHRWFADPEVTRWTGLRYPLSLAAISGRLAGAEATDPRFAVERRDTGETVGYVALRDITPESRNAELDLVIGERSAWGLGLGTDTTRTACRYAFDRLGLHRVHLWVFAEHAAAVRAYEKCGFAHEGVARDRFYKHGRWHDCLLMGLLAGELR